MLGKRFNHHGTKHRLYAVWSAMWYRCTVPTCKCWKNYGGRGISVCSRWEEFWNFVKDMEPTWRAGLTLERKDNDGPYSPENCKWADRFEQNHNSRKNKKITFNGVRKTLSEWMRETGLPYKTIHYRFNQGWSAERILKSKAGTNLLRNGFGQFESI